MVPRPLRILHPHRRAHCIQQGDPLTTARLLPQIRASASRSAHLRLQIRHRRGRPRRTPLLPTSSRAQLHERGRAGVSEQTRMSSFPRRHSLSTPHVVASPSSRIAGDLDNHGMEVRPWLPAQVSVA